MDRQELNMEDLNRVNGGTYGENYEKHLHCGNVKGKSGLGASVTWSGENGACNYPDRKTDNGCKNCKHNID